MEREVRLDDIFHLISCMPQSTENDIKINSKLTFRIIDNQPGAKVDIIRNEALALFADEAPPPI